MGQWTRGRRVVYSYNDEKKFIGFMSYEVNDKTYAFGAYDTVCNHLDEGELPKVSKKTPSKLWQDDKLPESIDSFEEAFEATIVALELQADAMATEPSRSTGIARDAANSIGVKIDTPPSS